jgi:hypothetical protein
MDFECVDDVGYPLEDVYKLVRDDMTALVPYLKDVEEIRVVERKDEGTGLRIVNVWRGSMSAAPSVVQKFITPDLVTWTDHAFWPHDKKQAEWRLEPRVGGKLFECTGTTSLVPGLAEGTCRIQIRSRLNVYPERLPGVPRLLAGTVRGRIEGFIVDLIRPNLQTLSRGVRGYFDDKARQG